MRLHVLEIPEQPGEIARWLEERIIATDLGAFVVQLSALGSAGSRSNREESDESPPATLSTLLSGYRQAVLDGGLRELPFDRLQMLLSHPRLLVDLQDVILEAQSDYWENLLSANEAVGEQTLKCRSALEDFLSRAPSPSEVPPDSDQPAQPHTPLAGLPLQAESLLARVVIPDREAVAAAAEPAAGGWEAYPWRSISIAGALAVAALLLVGFFFYSFPGGNPESPQGRVAQASGWGWSALETIGEEPSAARYLSELATLAKAWNNQRPTSSRDVAARLLEFRKGCSFLILSPHPALSDRDRDWLLFKCRVWARRLDEHLAALEKGNDPLTVRSEVDRLVDQISAALAQRASQV